MLLPKLMTRHEAAAQLGICERTLREHMKAGSIRSISVGRGEIRPKLMFDPADVVAFIDGQRRVRTPSPPPGKKARRTSPSLSNAEPSGFMALRAKRLAAKPEERDKADQAKARSRKLKAETS
jgi:hypothetical protein